MKEKIKKIIILVIILVLIGVGIYWYQYQKDVNFCKDVCSYMPNNKTWKINVEGRWLKEKLDTSKYFPEQEQCIDYCLRNK